MNHLLFKSDQPVSLDLEEVKLHKPLQTHYGGTGSKVALTNDRLMISVGGKIVEGPSAFSPSFRGVASASDFEVKTISEITQDTNAQTTVKAPLIPPPIGGEARTMLITTYPQELKSRDSNHFHVTNSLITKSSLVMAWVQGARGDSYDGCSVIINAITNGSCLISLTNSGSRAWNKAVFQIGVRLL